jgi:hypothetical protein
LFWRWDAIGGDWPAKANNVKIHKKREYSYHGKQQKEVSRERFIILY